MADLAKSAPTAGRVMQVNMSAGGVPKLPVDRAWVRRIGLEGDKHHESTVHGGPHRAVCLFSIEAIERLQAEGHPVEPGSVGENLTTTGIEWSLLPIGSRARIGRQLELELSSSTTPCATQKHNFSDGRFSRISIDLHPADSRMYARVVTEGEVRPGDEIHVSPPPPGSQAVDGALLRRLDRASAKSAIAAWRAAQDAGYDVRIIEDGDLAMSAAPGIDGPGFNHADGLASMPHLLGMVTDFYDEQRCQGWLVAESAPWPGAEPSLVIGVFAARPAEVPIVDPPHGVTIRLAGADDGPRVESVYAAADSTGISADAPVNPWPQVYSALAVHPHRRVLMAELDGRIVAASSLHLHNKTGWLRGAAVVPDARGRGLQRAMASARVRMALELGCDLVGAGAEPVGHSATNLNRMNFREIGRREHYLYLPPGLEP